MPICAENTLVTLFFILKYSDTSWLKYGKGIQAIRSPAPKIPKSVLFWQNQTNLRSLPCPANEHRRRQIIRNVNNYFYLPPGGLCPL